MKKHNFCAGPCILPQSVFEQASQAVKDFEGTGLSILEISHRDKRFQEILQDARKLLKQLMNLGEEYEVLFLQGGASLQFSMVPLNLATQADAPAYLDTGRWANNAFIEAKKICKPIVLATSKEEEYSFIPKDYTIPEEACYFHCTSNNTIYGTQMKQFPTTPKPIVCDMSSDILSRNIDYTQFSLVYAGAQKNIGAAGTTIVVIKKEILSKTRTSNLPSYLDYKVHIEKNSCFNTAPVFSIYTSYLNLLWLRDQGGVSTIEQLNKEKARILYNEIDRSDLWVGMAQREDRSAMNVCFRLKDERLEPLFSALCKEAGIEALKGHRTVGGYRASLYNALPVESVVALVECMKTLEQKA